MIMPRRIDEAKSERKRLYFDLICGIVSSILALTGIIFFAVMYGITNMGGWLTGLVFWILYLSLSIFMISIGVYTKYKERKLFGKS
jgi:O-antigen/teichoic acid export membrane protein